jgi:hypothetical protein
MSDTFEDAQREDFYSRMYGQFGPQWAEEHDEELYRQHYEDAVREFTAERLQSYYVAHPSLAEPVNGILQDAQVLLPSNRRAALVFAVIAVELAIKTVLLKPIVFGLVHIEGLARFITELTIQQTGMGRFEDLLTNILAQFGGVDLKSFTRAGSTKTLWKEIEEVQKARNAVVHRGESVPEETANLAVAIASTLLNNIFPLVLAKLDLHLHEPAMVCSKMHGVVAHVYFDPLPEQVPSISGSVEFDLDNLDLANMPEKITGKLRADFSNEAVAALHSAVCALPMWITSTMILYDIRIAPDSNNFIGTRAAVEIREL